MQEAFTGPALKQITGLALIYYIFIAMFWSLWDQSNGQTWTLQATSDLMDKHLFGFLAGIPAFGGACELPAAARADPGRERPLHPGHGADLHFRRLSASWASSSQ